MRGSNIINAGNGGCLRHKQESPYLEIQDLSLNFGGIVALSNVGIAVERARIHAIIGPNGAGKTSIFNVISGVYTPSRGMVLFCGKPLTGLKPYQIAAMGIGRTFQNLELFGHMTVIDNLLVGRHHLFKSGLFSGLVYYGKSLREEIRNREKVEAVIDFLEIENYRKKLVSELSYGIQKRVELGRALAMEPKILLLDEPMAGMNVEETEDMARFILDIKEELGITIIMVEHDMDVVMDISDRVTVLDFGAKIAEGTTREIQNNPMVIGAYLGEDV